ncbi:MAG: hypothetical protein COA74_07230 [Gammaproteobacteria bacterium]|nr:MAG: hypothetical protein COA74_07230 [Gammaproteobacteria bacterium]
MNSKFILAVLLIFFASCSQAASSTKLKDPTRPPVFASVKPGKKIIRNLKLSEIKITTKQRQAVINGKRLRKGNSIGGYRLQRIEVGYVILSNSKGTLRLNLINSRIIRKKL